MSRYERYMTLRRANNLRFLSFFCSLTTGFAWKLILPNQNINFLSKIFFSSYIAVPIKGTVVLGTAWDITENERAIIGEWELHHKWYIPVKIKIIGKNGKSFEAETEIIPGFYTKIHAIKEK